MAQPRSGPRAKASAAKCSAARANGALGGRPSAVALLRSRMRGLYAKIGDLCRDMDPGDLDLIIERLCRSPGSGRRFFLRSQIGGGYAF